jgi:SAM-dependent methyltransferase
MAPAARALVAVAALLISDMAEAGYVPYTPTPQAMVDRMLELAEVKEGDFLIDLGCGDGRILVTAAKRYGARGLGVDIDAQRLVEANALARKAGVADKVTFRKEDLFETDISKATVLALYLGLAVNIELRPRILATMKPGTRVLSHQFNMGDWLPDRTEQVEGRMLYLWIVPAKVGGSWQVDVDGAVGSRSFALDLDHRFQMLKGSAVIDGRALPLRDGRVSGERVRFVVDEGENGRTAYEGRLVDGRLEGDGWTARRR